jgi:uncharacterized protein YjiS (DUF1127 family)
MVTFNPGLSSRTAAAGTLTGGLRRLWHAFLLWRRRSNEMHHLMELDDYLLRDIGITRDDVARSLGRSFPLQ